MPGRSDFCSFEILLRISVLMEPFLIIKFVLFHFTVASCIVGAPCFENWIQKLWTYPKFTSQRLLPTDDQRGGFCTEPSDLFLCKVSQRFISAFSECRYTDISFVTIRDFFDQRCFFFLFRSKYLQGISGNMSQNKLVGDL